MKLSEKFGSFIFYYYLCTVNKKNKKYMNDKEKKKFDIALINSKVVYWYMRNMDGSFERYMDRINNYLEWLSKKPSEKVCYNAMKVVKEFINKYKLSDEFLREYCFELEHNNPREKWNKITRQRL